MGDLPSKVDKMLDILEIIAQKGDISLTELAKRLNTKIANITIYLDYLEELGLIYKYKKNRATRVKILADMVARIGDTMVAITENGAFVWRCPFKDICPYYKTGCTTVDNCPFLQAFNIAVSNVLEEINGTREKK